MLAIPYAQLLAGLAAGLIIWALMMRTPMLRDLLAAIAAACIADLLVGNHSPRGAESVVDWLAAEISSHPYFSLGLVLAATAVAALLRAQSQSQ
jgi:hypothetical protein